MQSHVKLLAVYLFFWDVTICAMRGDLASEHVKLCNVSNVCSGDGTGEISAAGSPAVLCSISHAPGALCLPLWAIVEKKTF